MPPKSSTSVCSPGNFQHRWVYLFSLRVMVMEASFIWLQDLLLLKLQSPQRRSAQLLCSARPGEKFGRGQDLLDCGLNNSALVSLPSPVLSLAPPVILNPAIKIIQTRDMKYC